MNAIVSVIVLLGILFFASAIYAIYWAAKSGQFHRLEEGAKTIFTPDEPMGEQTDFFPPSAKKKATSNKPAATK